MNHNSVTVRAERPDCLHLNTGQSVECVWMQAGIVNFHLCDLYGDCAGCAFDRSMRNFMAGQIPRNDRRLEPGWREEMRAKYQGSVKPCTHSLTGRLQTFTRCRRDYDCDDCPIDIELEYRPMMQAITTRH